MVRAERRKAQSATAAHTGRMTVAVWISEVCAPWVLNVVLFVALGWHTGALGVGIVAALTTGILPMVGILAMQRRGKVSDHHVTKAHQRTRVFFMIAVLLAALCGFLAVAETPREIWVAFGAAVAFIGVYAVVTALIGLKISVHVGLWICVFGFLAAAVSPWWGAALAFTPVLWWSRVRLGHHSSKEVGWGAVAGTAIMVLGVSLML